MSHYRNVCPVCGAVSQCRCPSKDKTQTNNPCPGCRGKEKK